MGVGLAMCYDLPMETVFTATATADTLKPIRVHYFDGTFKDFTLEEAGNEDTGGLGYSHNIKRIVVTSVETSPVISLGTISSED